MASDVAVKPRVLLEHYVHCMAPCGEKHERQRLNKAIGTLVQDYAWIHTGIGLIGNAAFLAGSIAFLPSFGTWEAIGMEWRTVGVWLFILGAFLMLIGAIGNLLVKVLEKQEKGPSA